MQYFGLILVTCLFLFRSALAKEKAYSIGSDLGNRAYQRKKVLLLINLQCVVDAIISMRKTHFY